MNKTVAVLAAALALSACASGYRPVVDPSMSKAPPGYYEHDLAYCQNLADQVPTGNEAASNALGGAALGAIAGGVIGSFSGDFGKGLAAGAGIGAATGAARGTVNAEEEKRRVIDNCMRNRGYSVLN
ncbi:hypothetical protein [Zavarzinia sp.]|uniref:hypothetical protein n=1 Tax=Zavarzinia sp. TaxID=2027920 RepID=UPI003BB7E85D|nr:hypothetical protein [Zavarzinia sp.]